MSAAAGPALDGMEAACRRNAQSPDLSLEREMEDLDALRPSASVPVEGEESAGDMLQRLGMDGLLWAVEFNKTAVALGYQPMDEGWLLGWFRNAIMAGYDEARRRFDPELRAAIAKATQP